jgi:hypothetical protein
LLLKRSEKPFDGQNFTKNIIEIFSDCYRIPKTEDETLNLKIKSFFDAEDNPREITSCPFDELFIWSIMLYSGRQKEFDLIKHYWSFTKYPIACCLMAIVLYNRFQKKHYVPDELKNKLIELNK